MGKDGGQGTDDSAKKRIPSGSLFLLQEGMSAEANDLSIAVFLELLGDDMVKDEGDAGAEKGGGHAQFVRFGQLADQERDADADQHHAPF